MCPVRQSSHAPTNSEPPARQDDLLSLIEKRRSVRKYRQRQPDPSEIDRIIRSAACTPSAHNAQPWRFYIIQDARKKSELIKQMAAKFRQDIEKNGVPGKVITGRIRRSIRLFWQAPVIIIAAVDMTGMDRYPDTTRQQAELTMATQSLAAAIQNLLLAARAVGLGGCWYCAPLFCPETVKSVLSLPTCNIPQALVTLGYPAENPPEPPRLQLDEIRLIL